MLNKNHKHIIKRDMKGPFLVKIEYHTCSNCDNQESNLIKSGFNPIREYKCAHENSKSEQIWVPKGYLGTDEKGDIKTPKWCPYLK